jgi:RNA polymerase sigma-70 factor (ECF subfamily)
MQMAETLMQEKTTHMSSENDEKHDEFLLVLEAKNDLKKFIHIYDCFMPSIYRYVFSRLGNKKDAEDITSQVFLGALEGINRYCHRGHLISWLFTIARNKINDHFRKSRGIISIDLISEPVEIFDGLPNLIKEYEISELMNLVSALSEKEKELIRLRFGAQLSFSEISKIVNKSEDAVKKQFYRLLARMERKMEGNYDR